MREDPIPEPGDRAVRPFSNGTEWEIWSAKVCGAGEGCIHDSTYGQPTEHPLDTEANCPLITLALMETWPHEWKVRTVTYAGGSYETPGECSEFTETEPLEQAEPVLSVDLFGEYNHEPTGGRR